MLCAYSLVVMMQECILRVFVCFLRGGYSPAQGVSYEFFPPSRGLGGPNELGTSSNPHPVQHVPEIPKQEAQKQTEINVARDSVDQETGMLLEVRQSR